MIDIIVKYISPSRFKHLEFFSILIRSALYYTASRYRELSRSVVQKGEQEVHEVHECSRYRSAVGTGVQ